ncbi:hypothetical protein JTE90_024539 [Oedothorax gibbosus]|uniref:Uncharacterized protein n=1 Tax=Oedothorax gibbosus TaxID=931172 RepID=A0AAV6VDX2_9ARAC|nr:hypothetical protein JTE90_024539 [Oedothorax gibbosus]
MVTGFPMSAPTSVITTGNRGPNGIFIPSAEPALAIIIQDPVSMKGNSIRGLWRVPPKPNHSLLQLFKRDNKSAHPKSAANSPIQKPSRQQQHLVWTPTLQTEISTRGYPRRRLQKSSGKDGSLARSVISPSLLIGIHRK